MADKNPKDKCKTCFIKEYCTPEFAEECLFMDECIDAQEPITDEEVCRMCGELNEVCSDGTCKDCTEESCND